MGARVPVHVEECRADAGFRGILVEACRSESACVGVGWGQRSTSNRLTSSPVRGAGERCEARPGYQV
jgi:hypothetical protein